MNEEIQKTEETPTPEENMPIPEKKEQIIPTWVGIIILIALVSAFLFFFLKFREMGKPDVSTKTPKTSVSETNQTANNVSPTTAAKTPAVGNTEPASGSNVDIDYELKQMDNSAKNINENDFDSNSFSNAQIGL